MFQSNVGGEEEEEEEEEKPMLEENQNRENSQVTESGCIISRHSPAKNANVDIYQRGEEDLILSE